MSRGWDECETGGFTFVWTILDLSRCLQKKGRCLDSTCFIAVDTIWHLSLYSRGNTDGDTIECSLRKSCASAEVEIAVDCEMCFCTTIGGRLGVDRKENVEFVRSSTHPHAAPFHRHVSERLPRDTLVVHCHLWRQGSDRTEAPVHCHQLTRVPVQKQTFFWKIEGFSALAPKEEKRCCLTPVQSECPSLLFEMFTSGSDDTRLEVGVVFEYVAVPTLFTCCIWVQRHDGTFLKVLTDEDWLEETKDGEGLLRIFPQFLSKRKLMADKDSYLPWDALTLKCEVGLTHDRNEIEQVVYAHSTPTAVDMFRKLRYFLPSPLPHAALHTLSSDLRLLLEGGNALSDFELTAGGRAFPVHRLLLSARSAVFRNMFQNERPDSPLCIPDVDPDTLDRMLRYVYCDAVQDMRWQDVALLYAAADKYELQDLRKRCSVLLGRRLDPSNAVEVLVLAGRHGDLDLKRAVQEFVFNRGKEDFLTSEGWRLLEQENPRLVLETLRRMFFEKVLSPTPRENERCVRKVGLTFVWTIENFSHYVERKYHDRPYFRSADVTSPSGFNGVGQWYLKLFPRVKADRLEIWMHRFPYMVNACEVCLCTVDGKRLGVCQRSNMVAAEDQMFLFKRRMVEHLPDETLVVHCHVYRRREDRNDTPIHCHQLTRIPVQKKTFFWNVGDFSSLRLGEERVLCLPPVERKRPTLKFKMSLDGETVDEASVRIVVCIEGLTPETFLTCKMSILDPEGNTLNCMDDRWWLDSDNAFEFPEFLTRRELMCERASYLPGDVLSLHCEVTVSDGNHTLEQVVYGRSTRDAVDIFHARHFSPSLDQDTSYTLQEDLGFLYESGDQYDLELRAASGSRARTFPVHRLLLGARSSLLRDMLKHCSGTFYVPDLEPDVLDRMLRYVYTDVLPDIRWPDAVRLCDAARRFRLPNLLRWCLDLLGIHEPDRDVLETEPLSEGVWLDFEMRPVQSRMRRSSETFGLSTFTGIRSILEPPDS